MKRVSFKVAKAIKEVGYPQDCYNEYWVKFKNKAEPLIINSDEALDFYENISDETDENYVEDYYAVTEYLGVWLWLVREKNILLRIAMTTDEGIEICWNCFCKKPYIFLERPDPEEAIIAAIEYLVNNKLFEVL